MADDIGAFLATKVNEYRILSAPLERAAREMEYEHQLLRSKYESEIAEEVPALGSVADLLNVSVLDMLMAPDQRSFVADAMERAGLSSAEVLQHLRSLGPPPRGEELEALGLAS